MSLHNPVQLLLARKLPDLGQARASLPWAEMDPWTAVELGVLRFGAYDWGFRGGLGGVKRSRVAEDTPP